MKFILKLLKWLAIILIIIVVAGSVWISNETVKQITHLSNPEDTKINTQNYLKQEGFDLDAFKDTYHYQETEMKSSFEEHIIPFASIEASKANQGTVIMAHGLGSSKESIFPKAKIFLDLGYHVIAYDQRNSGDNTAKTNSFGVHESKDMIDLVHFVEKEYQPASLILWGESFGGGTAALATAELGNDIIDFLILDSPMNDGKTLTEMNMAEIPDQTGIPMAYLMFISDLGLKISQGFGFSDAFPSQKLEGNTTPLLVIHSKNDEVIPYSMGKAIFDASASPHKTMHTVEKGKHVMLIHENTREYKKVITEFLKIQD